MKGKALQASYAVPALCRFPLKASALMIAKTHNLFSSVHQRPQIHFAKTRGKEMNVPGFFQNVATMFFSQLTLIRNSEIVFRLVALQ